MEEIFKTLGYSTAGYLVFRCVRCVQLLCSDCDLDTARAAAFAPPDAFKDKVVWVTGASSGIGKAICQLLGEQGAKLVISSRLHSLDKLYELRVSLPLPLSDVSIVPLDLRDFDSLPLAAEAAVKAYGRLDVLVNCAGVGTRALAQDTLFSVDRDVCNVDYLGQICLAKCVLPTFIAQKHGQFVNISSLAGKVPLPMRSSYCGAKAAVLGWFGTLRSEQKRNNIIVTNVCPGSVRTNVSRNALTGGGEPFDKMDTNIDKGMTAERAAQLIVAAAHKGLWEVWMWANPVEAMLLYSKQYRPGLFKILIAFLEDTIRSTSVEAADCK